MSSLFADTHNVVAILEKLDAAEGFEQIIDFLSGSYIHYALTVSPPIYISCIKQFWNSVSVKRSGDVTRLQALVDKKKIVISEAIIRESLQLNDAKGVVCLPNEEIFAGLAQMGYEKPSTKLTFYKTNIADLSTHTTRYISPTLTQKVFSNMQKVRKGFSGDETPLFESMLVVRDVAERQRHMFQLREIMFKSMLQRKLFHPPPRHHHHLHLLTNHPVHLNHKMQKVHLSCFSSMQEDDTEVQEAVEIMTTAKLMTEVVTTAATQVAAASTPIPAAKPKILNIAAAPAVLKRKRKGVVIRDPEEELPFDTPAETPKVKDKGKGILIEALKPMKKKVQIEMDAEYHGMKKKPQTESEARENKIFYLKNTKGYKMDFFKGKKYGEILPIFQDKFDANMRFLFKSREEMEAEDEEIIKSINETLAQKAAKRRKMSEEAQEAEDLRKRLEIV
nr:hypothetical protein [Tanacetum cinerariifolium]